MPESPTRRDLKGLPTKNRLPVARPLVRLDSVRCSAFSFGFGSNVSACDGPPSMNSMITAFAFGSCIGGFGVSGPAVCG